MNWLRRLLRVDVARTTSTSPTSKILRKISDPTFTDAEVLSPGIDIRRPEHRAMLLRRRATRQHIDEVLNKLEQS